MPFMRDNKNEKNYFFLEYRSLISNFAAELLK